jgi:phosphate:Na+ symporter
MTLAAQQVVPPEAALAMVLGANIGNVAPQFLAAGGSPEARRLALGNLIMRGLGCAICLPLLPWLARAMAMLEPATARQVADFHTLFNLALAAVFMGLLAPLARLCTWLQPSARAAGDPGRPQYIDPSALTTPSVALANAEREVLRMVDIVSSMLNMSLEALQDDDRKLLAKLSAMDSTLDQLHNAVKLHMTALGRDDDLSERDAQRCSEIVGFAINLEHIGDILDHSLREMAAKKIKRRLVFSPEGLREIIEMYERLLADLQLATSVFMLGEYQAARRLIEQKDRMRDMEQAAIENHMRRLREGRPQSIETSSLHIDIARDLKRIAAHIASVAYPILQRNGTLRRSRLLNDNEVLAEGQGESAIGSQS